MSIPVRIPKKVVLDIGYLKAYRYPCKRTPMLTRQDEYLWYLSKNKKRSPLTIAAYKKDIEQFVEYLGNHPGGNAETELNNVVLSTSAQIARQYASALICWGFNPSSVNRKISVLHGFYDFLIRTENLSVNPFAVVTRPNKPSPELQYFSSSTIKQIFDAIGSASWLAFRDRAILGLLFNTGMRISELLRIRRDDIDWQNGFVSIHCNGITSRTVKLWAWVLDELRQYDNFCCQHGKIITDVFFVNRDNGPLTARSIRRKFLGYSQRAGLNVPITPATLRHSFAMLMLQNGASPDTLRRQLGHLSRSSIRPYLDCFNQKSSDNVEANT